MKKTLKLVKDFLRPDVTYKEQLNYIYISIIETIKILKNGNKT